MERITLIHRRLQNQEYPNCSSLACEFEVSTRTVKRDLDFMSCRMNLPVKFNPYKNGYYYTRPVEQFPPIPTTEAEVFALLVTQKAIAQYSGTPFEQPLQAAFRKLTGQLDRKVQFSIGALDEVVSFRPFAPEDSDVQRFELISRALQLHRVLKFEYRNKGTSRPQTRTVHPRHLACVENHWYLFAYDADRAAMRTFALARLRRPQLTRKRFTPDRKFDLNEYLSGSLSVFKGGDDYEVVVDFDAWAADEIRGRRWHATQELTELPRGWLRMRLRLNNIEEVEKWVLSMGTHATVVRPRKLAERVGKIGRELAERYCSRSS